MWKTRTIRLALLVLGTSIGLAAQSSPSQPDTAPAPAFGQTAPILSPENPPVTGLDEPALDLRTSSRSFISPALQVSESADSNGRNQLGGSGLESVTHVLGAVDLQQFWPKSDLFVEYLGGGAFYSSPYDAKQLEAAGAEGVTRWRTGRASLRDSFSYLPDGSFQLGLGGLPGFGLATGGFGMGQQGGVLPGSLQWGNAQLGSVGNVSRIANTGILDVVQAVNPRSAITVAGGFSDAHFFDTTTCSPEKVPCLVNSDEVIVEGGYSHLLGRHDQIGVVYAFLLFQFPQYSGGQAYNHIANVRWSHVISGRLSLVAGVGPRYTELEQGGYVSSWSVSARVQLAYKMGHAYLTAAYEKFTSPGSGFYAGANVQAARLGYVRPLGRTWEFYGNVGYAHNSRLQSGGNAIGAGSYDNVTVSTIFRKHLGRTYEFLATYRFGVDDFSSPVCTSGSCGKTSERQVGSVGLEWHPKPTRIE